MYIKQCHLPISEEAVSDFFILVLVYLQNSKQLLFGISMNTSTVGHQSI